MKDFGRFPLPIVAFSLTSIAVLASMLLPSCTMAGDNGAASRTDSIAAAVSHIASDCPGEMGVAVIIDNKDTVAIGNKSIYPMMSVFKVHQALAVCNGFDRKGIALDSVVTIKHDELDAQTWSPMLKEHQEATITLQVKDLLRYTLTLSDNNASNFMFEELVSTAATDSFIATLIPRSSFQIVYTESEMSSDHDKAYSNYTSPLGAAMLMNRLYTDSLVSHKKQEFIKHTLTECSTGKDRIAAPLIGKAGTTIAHKTGSGYTNGKGILAAHNDVAYICLPNGTHYTLAIFVKDFSGNEAQASKAMAQVSAAIYDILAR